MSPPNKEKVLPSRYWLGSCSRTRRTEERKYKPTISVQKRTREVVVSETCEPPETEEAMVPNASNDRERKYKKFLVEEPTRNAMNARERYWESCSAVTLME